MYIPYSCSYVENGTLKYIFTWQPEGFNEQPADQYFGAAGLIINNNITYPKTGNISEGIPGFDDTNFYSVFGS